MNQQTSGNVNSSIQCSVKDCAYHSKNSCSLNRIQVGCSDSRVTNCHSTECASFQMTNQGTIR